MIKKYKAFMGKIEEWEILRETAKQVVVVNGLGREVRESKNCDWHSYHDTYEEAKQHLVDKAQAEVDSAERMLKLKIKRLEEMKSL